jgi:diguanylate cyclase (GGDEF)-like protein/PAS domain S-box-containing protein
MAAAKQSARMALALIACLLSMAFALADETIITPDATVQPKSLTVVLDDNYPPYIYRDAEGRLQGILKDSWDLWQTRTGIKVNLLATDWGRAQSIMQTGGADVIDTMFTTPERQKLYDFSAPYATIEVPIFFHRSISGIVGPDSLKGFTIGVKDGDACIDYLQSHGLADYQRYPSYEELIQGAVRQEVRVLCIDKPPALFYLHRLGLADEFRHSPPLYVGAFHRAVAKGRVELLREVEAGFTQITAAERQAIEARWFGTPVPVWGGSRFAPYGFSALLSIGVLALLMGLWTLTLRRRVATRTADLSAALVALRQANAQAERSRDDLAATLEAIPDLMFEVDSEGRYLDYRARRIDLLAAPPERIIGHTVDEMLPPAAAAIAMSALKEAAVKGSSHGAQIMLPLAVGDHWFELSIARKPMAAGTLDRFIVLSRDITERKQAAQKLALVSFALDHVREAAYLADRQGRFHYVNAEACRVTGRSREELLALRVIDIDADCRTQAQWDNSWEQTQAQRTQLFESRHTTADGRAFPVEVNANYFEFGGQGYILGLVRDITERKQAEEQIHNLAYFDALTGLPNRRLLQDRLQHALVSANRNREYGALMILDLDHFKVINDTRGHDIGDRLLIEVAQRLRTSVRQEDTVSRLGGDEYVVMVEGLGRSESAAIAEAEAIAEKIRAALNLSYLLDDGRGGTNAYLNTPSIGITLFHGSENSPDVLLKQSDLALYQAKDAGRNAIRFFSPAMQSAIDSRTALEEALRQGILNKEFHLYYQPQFDGAGRLLGAEALLRWLPSGQAAVPPGQFIPLAEETGLILPIGLWVLETACAQIKAWEADPRSRHLDLAVNVSARQFKQPDFVQHVAAILAHTEADPTRLKLELTEGVVLANIDEVIGRMQALKALGIGFSLDDFGTGYSSLSYLKRLPLDEVKIDQSFVRDITHDPNDAAIVRAILAMSRTLGLHVVAEGVETSEQHSFLRDNGCPAYQGYLLGRPLPIADWAALLEK